MGTIHYLIVALIAVTGYVVYSRIAEGRDRPDYSWRNEMPDVWDEPRAKEYPNLRLGFDDRYVLMRLRNQSPAFCDGKGRLRKSPDVTRLKVILQSVIDAQPGIYHVILRKEGIEFNGYLTEDMGSIIEF